VANVVLKVGTFLESKNLTRLCLFVCGQIPGGQVLHVSDSKRKRYQKRLELADEIAEAVEILRTHHPRDDEILLRCRAEKLRQERYERGRWPSSDELAIEMVWDEAHFENVIRKPDAL
jgi:hypothetical protein